VTVRPTAYRGRHLYGVLDLFPEPQPAVHDVTANPTGSWEAQQARNLAMDLGARMDTSRFVIRDRDTRYTLAFDGVFDVEGIQLMETPLRAPRRSPRRSSI
jgi:hypothetical protein